MRTKQGKSHLRRRKPKNVRRTYYRLLAVEHEGTVKRVQKLAPYLGKNK